MASKSATKKPYTLADIEKHPRIPPKVLLKAFAEHCKQFKSMQPQLSWHHTHPEADFIYQIEQAIGAWLPAQHEDFLTAVLSHEVELATIKEGLTATRNLIFKSLEVEGKGDDRHFKEELLEDYPVAAKGDRPDKKTKRSSKSTQATDEENDMTTPKVKTKDKSEEKKPVAKARPPGSKGQLTPIDTRDWGKLPETTKLTRGEEPRQKGSIRGKIFGLLPLGKNTITVKALIEKTRKSLRVSETIAANSVYQVVNRFHAKIVR